MTDISIPLVQFRFGKQMTVRMSANNTTADHSCILDGKRLLHLCFKARYIYTSTNIFKSRQTNSGIKGSLIVVRDIFAAGDINYNQTLFNLCYYYQQLPEASSLLRSGFAYIIYMYVRMKLRSCELISGISTLSS